MRFGSRNHQKLQRVLLSSDTHPGLEHHQSEAMTAADDTTTWLDKDFTLEVHVTRLNGEETKVIKCSFEKGRDDYYYTVGRVLLHALYIYPAPVNSRPKLTLCGRVLDAESNDMDMNIGTYLDRFCND